MSSASGQVRGSRAYSTGVPKKSTNSLSNSRIGLQRLNVILNHLLIFDLWSRFHARNTSVAKPLNMPTLASTFRRIHEEEWGHATGQAADAMGPGPTGNARRDRIRAGRKEDEHRRGHGRHRRRTRGCPDGR